MGAGVDDEADDVQGQLRLTDEQLEAGLTPREAAAEAVTRQAEGRAPEASPADGPTEAG